MSGLASPKNEAKFALDLRDPTRFAIAASPSQKMAAGGGGGTDQPSKARSVFQGDEFNRALSGTRRAAAPDHAATRQGGWLQARPA